MKDNQRIKNFIKQENKLNKNAYKKVKQNLKEIIKFILQWDIKRMYLFGSFLHKNDFYCNSDIDIAVDGISTPEFSKLWFELGLKFPLKIDLINLDDCDEYFKLAIKKRGKLIYEKKRH